MGSGLMTDAKDNTSRDSILSKVWHDLVQRTFADYALRLGILDKYPELEKKGAGPFITGGKRFLKVDAERKLLIGTLGWFDADNAFWKFVSQEDKWSALVKLQEQIGQYCLRERWEYKVIIEPDFVDLPDFQWLCGKPTIKPKAKRTEVIEIEQPEVVHVGHLMTKPRYPLRRPRNPEAEFRRNLGGGKSLRIIPLTREVESDGVMVEKKEIPHGLICTQVEILCFNVYRATGARFLAFDSPREILSLIGYSANTKNYRTLNRQIMNLAWSSSILSDSRSNEMYQVQPFLFASLWDEEPSRIVSYVDSRTGKQITKRNPGKRKLSKIDQPFLIPSVILFNPVWLNQVSKHYHNVDLNLLNRLTSSVITYTLLLKCYELGTRPASGLVPYWGPNGLAQELGLKDETLQQRRNARKKIKESFQWIREEAGCPFIADQDALRYHEWRPLLGKHRAKLPIPEATKNIIRIAEASGADATSLIRDQRSHTLNVLESQRMEALSGMELDPDEHDQISLF